MKYWLIEVLLATDQKKSWVCHGAGMSMAQFPLPEAGPLFFTLVLYLFP